MRVEVTCPHCYERLAIDIVRNRAASRRRARRPRRLHKALTGFMAVCGARASCYADRRSGSSVHRWRDVACKRCLSLRESDNKPRGRK